MMTSGPKRTTSSFAACPVRPGRRPRPAGKRLQVLRLAAEERGDLFPAQLLGHHTSIGRVGETEPVRTLPSTLLRALARIVGEPQVLTGEATTGFATDWTGRYRGRAAVVVRPENTTEVAAVLALCTEAGLAVVPQGGNTGLVGGGVPRHGEVVLSLTRLDRLGPVDQEAAQVTAGAGVTLRRVADADPDLDLGILIASRDSATVGGAVATNAAGCGCCGSGRCGRSCAASRPCSRTARWCRTWAGWSRTTPATTTRRCWPGPRAPWP